MQWNDARRVVEDLRRQTQLWLPPLTERRGFSSSRVEHLLQGLVAAMPDDETYLEVGSLEGRTLEAAAKDNPRKRIVACDPGHKYGTTPDDGLGGNVTFWAEPWEHVLGRLPGKIGCAFYDADHSRNATREFLLCVRESLADEAVVVLDDWDRETVRDGAFAAMGDDPRFQLLREMPEYGDGITCSPHHFGWFFGTAVLGWKR